MKPQFLFFSLLLALLMLASGCSAMPQVEAVQGDEYSEVLEFSEPISEGIFQAINNRDYTAFSQNFDEMMKKALTEEDFLKMADTFTEKIGQYSAMSTDNVEKIENLYVVTYTLQFTEEEVAARVSFRQGDPPQVAGLWFDSPKLRE